MSGPFAESLFPLLQIFCNKPQLTLTPSSYNCTLIEEIENEWSCYLLWRKSGDSSTRTRQQDGLTRLIIVSLKMIGGSNVAGVEHWNSHSLTKKGQSGTKTGKMAFNQAKEGGELRRKKSLKKT